MSISCSCLRVHKFGRTALKKIKAVFQVTNVLILIDRLADGVAAVRLPLAGAFAIWLF